MSIRIYFLKRLATKVELGTIEDNQDFRIGSGGEVGCHVELADRRISSCHAILRCEPDKDYLTVEDVSQNGSLVNSIFLHRKKMRIPVQFSVLQIGEYLFWFEHTGTIPSGRKENEFLNRLKQESNIAPDLCPRKALARYLLRIILPQEENFHSFCIAHCDEVARLFSANMTRTSKENLIVERVEPERIVERLDSNDATIEQRSLVRCVRERWQRQGNLVGEG